MAFVQRQLGIDGGFGPTLRELREQRKLTRETLAELTKIHVSIIAALEEERIEDLTDPQYAERHVHAIVQLLEGRLAYFLPKYRELIAKKLPPNREVFGVRPTVRRRDFFVTTQFVAFGGFLLLVGITGAYLVWQARILQDPPPLVISSPSEGQSLSEPRVEIRGTTDPGAVVSVNGRNAVVDPSGAFYDDVYVPRGLTTFTIIARRRYGSSVTETRRVTFAAPTTTQ